MADDDSKLAERLKQREKARSTAQMAILLEAIATPGKVKFVESDGEVFIVDTTTERVIGRYGKLELLDLPTGLEPEKR